MSGQTQNPLYLLENEKLLKIINNFTRATDITIDINDEKGFPVVSHDYFYGFCNYIRSTAEGLRRCIASNAEAGFLTARTSQVAYFTCHAGMMLVAVPIMLEGEFIGSITCGQMHLQKPDYQAEEKMLAATADLGLDRQLLLRTYREVAVCSLEKCQAATSLISYMIDYILELIYHQRQQEKAASQKIRELTREVARARLATGRQTARLKKLQSHIRPQFIYNTLSSITGLVELEEKHKALQVVYSMAGLLRYNLDRYGDLVVLADELECVRNFLTIQKIRFCHRLEFSMHIPGNLHSRVIPFMSLFPVVEQLLLSLEHTTSTLHLEIGGREEKAGWRLYVQTNAFSGQNLERNLRHVHYRLQLFCGREYGMRCQQLPQGERVELFLPGQLKNGVGSGYKVLK
ncbi:MAG: sensor histidine kinase [Desulfurispora sp.]|uniref:sensor histidine kinase n=1 Tax=Desulfurispora sp. TaxID=3014275 RepID=UPI00404998A3